MKLCAKMVLGWRLPLSIPALMAICDLTEEEDELAAAHSRSPSPALWAGAAGFRGDSLLQLGPLPCRNHRERFGANVYTGRSDSGRRWLDRYDTRNRAIVPGAVRLPDEPWHLGCP